MSEWREVSEEQVISMGGQAVLSTYPSLGDALEAVYPDFTWQTDKLPHGYWQDEKHLLNALDKVEKQLGISKVSTLLSCSCCGCGICCVFVSS